MSNDKLAFIIGLLGSLHCIGMCGPLAFSVPSLRQGQWNVVFDKLNYQLGRIISYCLLGILTGLVGRQLWLSGLQQGISILSGTLILTVACSRLLKLSWFHQSEAFLLKPFSKMLTYALKHRANHLIIGIVNGFLPCGFVYLALAGAVNTGSVPDAVSYMFWFGTGTLPLMFMATVSISFTGQLLRRRIMRIIPYMMLFLGAWFILRGLSLDIPYLSPGSPATPITICK